MTRAAMPRSGQEAAALARSGDGCLYRWPGGFWATTPAPKKGDENFGRPPARYATTIGVLCLVNRGAAEVIERRANDEMAAVRLVDREVAALPSPDGLREAR